MSKRNIKDLKQDLDQDHTNKKKILHKKKKYRLLKNPNQTSELQIYYTKDNVALVVPKSGYYFSLDKSMDEVIDYLKKEKGFIEVD